MKNLIIITIALISMNVTASNFTCKFSKGWDRPANDNAVKLAAALKVKTCNSSKFVKFVKEGKHTMSALKRNSNGGVKALKFN